MRILLISTSFPSRSPDGREAAGSFVADFSEALSESVAVTVLAPGPVADTEIVHDHLSIIRFQAPRLPLSQLNLLNPADALSIVNTLRQGWLAAEQIVQSQPIDHVFALWALPSGYWAHQLWKRYGIEYSTWALGSDIWGLGKIPIVRSLLRTVLRDARRCFADGYRLRDDVVRLAGRPCEFLASTRKLPVTPGKKLAQAAPYRLSFLGRWHRNKGVDILLDSLGRLSEADWRRIASIQICGGGPLERLVADRCAALQSAGRPVTRRGYLDTRTAADLLFDTDYLLLPSRIESIPVIFSDAMKTRCPMVAMPVGDLPRLLDTYHAGILAERVDAESFAQAIRVATAHSPQEFAQGLEHGASDFDLGEITKRFLADINAH